MLSSSGRPHRRGCCLVSILAVGVPALAILVALLLVVEVRKYRAGRHLISGRRLALRLISGLLLIGLLAAIFVGLFVLRLVDASSRPQLFLAFWGGCLVGGFVLLFLMLADVREVEDRSLKRQHEMWRDFARFIAGQMEGGQGERGSLPADSQTEDERKE